MKTYICRVDELRKLSLPKNIMDNLGIKVLDNVEIIEKNNFVILRSYSPLLKIRSLINEICNNLCYALNHNVIVTDLNSIISSNVKGLSNKKISDNLKFSILRRENILEIHDKELILTNRFILNTPYIINSIVSKGNVIGLIIIYDVNGVDEVDYKISSCVSNFIGKYVE